jgi:hypothetical protein
MTSARLFFLRAIVDLFAFDHILKEALRCSVLTAPMFSWFSIELRLEAILKYDPSFTGLSERMVVRCFFGSIL